MGRYLILPFFLFLGILLGGYILYSIEGQLTFNFQNFWIMALAGIYLMIISWIWSATSKSFDSVFDWRVYFSKRLTLGLLTHFSIILSPFLFLFYTDFIIIKTLVKIIILAFLVVTVHEMLWFMLYSYNYYTYGQIQLIRQNREQLNLQFEALRSQLNPHYLFNSLNTVSSLIDKDPQPAEVFIRRLVETYQYIINSQEKLLVSYKEEITFVQAYLYLLKVRFGDAIYIKYALDDQIMKKNIPPMTLQILVENAIKHNAFSTQDPLVIQVKLNKENEVSISNKKSPKPDKDESFQIGLNNIIERFKFFTGKPVKVLDDSIFEVKIPLLA